jgi:hypothetical protein
MSATASRCAQLARRQPISSPVRRRSRCPGEVGARAGRTPAREEIAMRRLWTALRAAEDGMTTAEYAVGTVAACGFGGVLYRILTSGVVSGLLQDVISHALSILS